jgi:hypothetical protein
MIVALNYVHNRHNNTIDGLLKQKYCYSSDPGRKVNNKKRIPRKTGMSEITNRSIDHDWYFPISSFSLACPTGTLSDD